MSREHEEWYSTEQVAQRVGMSPEWVRRQIVAGRLRARMFTTASRPTYRISASALQEFLDRYGRETGAD